MYNPSLEIREERTLRTEVPKQYSVHKGSPPQAIRLCAEQHRHLFVLETFRL